MIIVGYRSGYLFLFRLSYWCDCLKNSLKEGDLCLSGQEKQSEGIRFGVWRHFTKDQNAQLT